MELLFITIASIGILFGWWLVYFYKKSWVFYIIAIPLFVGGFIAFIMFIIEKLVDLYLILKKKEDEKIIN